MNASDLDSRVRWIDHNEKRILRIDLGGLTGAQGNPVLDRQAEIFKKTKNKFLLLVNLTDGVANTEFMEHAKKLGKEVFIPQIEKEAMYGAKGLQLILLQAYNTFTGASKYTKHFTTETEALEWLAN